MEAVWKNNMTEQIILICDEGLARVDVTLCNFLFKLLSPITYLLEEIFEFFNYHIFINIFNQLSTRNKLIGYVMTGTV